MDNPLLEWAKAFRSQTESMGGKPDVDYATYKPTEKELNNIVYLSLKMALSREMEKTDWEAIKDRCPTTPQTVRGMDDRFIPAVAEYIWDYILGRPARISQDDLIEVVRAIRDRLYCLDKRKRESAAI